MRRYTLVSLVIVATAVSGCSPFDLTGSGSEADEGFEESEGKAQVEFRFYDRSEKKRMPPFRITFEDPAHSKTLTRSDFPSAGSVGPFETTTSGTLQVSASLLKKGNVATTGKVSLPLEPDMKYSISIEVSNRNPTQYCFGCKGSRAFAVDPSLDYATNDTLFIVWGHDSISNPVLY